MFERFLNDKRSMVLAEQALPGRAEKMQVPDKHFVNGGSMLDSAGQLHCPDGSVRAMFGMGCFWGAERKFWQLEGVSLTAVGYAAGYTQNPSYEEVCSGRTGHNEVVALVFNPQEIKYAALLAVFFEGHDPTQGMQQGNDVGTQYRSGIYCYGAEQLAQARQAVVQYQAQLKKAGRGDITTEIIQAPDFYFAESYHQQYLAKNPGGYCGLGGTGVCFN
ncbi:MAG: peptide-methionine (S)-S-oxide reductase MsrA [Gammaproteobacteria bacterium]|nr:peptide-methionine (S)-S-oxide reductase MsrA [Gammaproteobacteria bacterium]MBT8151547.1 peptide-methionine (S)-S-oxide reductase MsrA [Gammaproteobacteria bacterium]NND38070.1 peptide-methionine (S)-S-oxide reductase MsrA [Pseudomonadales bacterium]NNM11138.1 peptide-methionine (S)-S-oxide reductase MsrA [Pseudomonadales bacterium]RZV58865.1 MAG: peptide-methionine (S)-S-oxide reductase MsrA [Pseudomonadales bacterium]